MSTATASLHTTAELTFIGCDDRTEIVVFQSRSAHDAARVNTVALDLLTGAIICDCKGAEFGRVCWHAAHVVNAWHQSPAMRACRFLSPIALINQGRKAAMMIATYRQRCGRPLQDDVLLLVAARAEYRRRQAADLAAPAIVAVDAADLALAA